MPNKNLSHSGLWGRNPQDFIEQVKSIRMFHLEAVQIIIIKLE
jgi:hypothetical protein